MASGERFYHDVSLRGPVPDRLLVRLPVLRVPDPDVAARLARIAEGHAREFFAPDTPGFAYAHGFSWLGPLAHAEAAGQGGRHVAGALFEAWAAEHGRYAPRAWAPVLAAQRTEAMLTHADLLLEGRDAPMREQVFGTLIRQTRHLAKAAKRAPAEGRLAAAAGLMIGALCLPGADGPERAGKAALAAALGAFTSGDLPDGLRRTAKAERLAQSLLALRAAYKARGLTPPPALADAVGVMRLLLGALALPQADTLAVLPGGAEGDPVLMAALGLLRRAEGDALLDRYGHVRLTASAASVHADLRGPAGGAFALSDGASRIVTAAGAPGPALRALSPRMRDWADALALPGASATLDARGFGDAKAVWEDAGEGAVLSLRRKGPGGAHERRLFLRTDGGALIGEDQAPAPGAAYRFPLHPDVEVRPLEDARALLVLPSGRSWRFEAANAALVVEDGIYAGGHAPRPSRQLVLTAEREGLRWALRRA